MSIQIQSAKCRKCGRCVAICPGNLIKRSADGTAYIRRPADCWGCTSCLKECAFGAIAFFLGADMGGLGSTLRVEQDGDLRHWIVQRPDGETVSITVDRKNANQY